METGVLERVRALEADIECCIDSIVQQTMFSEEITNNRHRILFDHFRLQQLAEINRLTEKLLDAYLDEDDVVAARDAPAHGQEVLSSALRRFEGRIVNIREYHFAYNSLPPVTVKFHTPDVAVLDRLFSAREHFGDCLDLDSGYGSYSAFVAHSIELREKLVNLFSETQSVPKSNGRVSALAKKLVAVGEDWEGRPDFFQYIGDIPKLPLQIVPSLRKIFGFSLYRTYITEFLQYLCDFYDRVYPLDVDKRKQALTTAESEWEEFWAALEAERHHITVEIGENDADGQDSDNSDGDGELGNRSKQADAHAATAGALTEYAAYRARHPSSVKRSAGLAVPPPLKRYIKSYALWPLDFLEREIFPAASEQLTESSDDSSCSPALLSTLRSLHDCLPQSLADVKALSLAEGQVVYLLNNLLLDTYQQTERRLLQDHGKTTEELENDTQRAEQEFLDSLENVKRQLRNSLEGTVADAAQYRLQSEMERARAAGGVLGHAEEGRSGYGTHPHQRGRHGPSAEQRAAEREEARRLAKQREEEARARILGDPTGSKVVLGDDGNPLPRWEVQLKQLDKVFRCDVCGGTIYRGPKIFRQHFALDRHEEGLRRLGITHSFKRYDGLATISAVVDMRAKLQRLEVLENTFKRIEREHDMEETQDVHGNVTTAAISKRARTR